MKKSEVKSLIHSEYQIKASDYHFIKVDRAFSELLGYSANELKDMSFVDLLHPDEVENWKEMITDYTKDDNAEIIYAEWRLINKQKQIVYIVGYKTIDFLNDELVINGNFIDVTEDRKDKFSYQNFLRQLPCGYVEINHALGDKITYVNNVFLDMIGFKENVVDYSTVLSETDYEYLLYITKDVSFKPEEDLKMKINNKVFHISAIRNISANNSIITQCVFNDISEAEEILHKFVDTNQQIKSLLNYLPGPSAIFKYDNNDKISLLHGNDEYYDILHDDLASERDYGRKNIFNYVYIKDKKIIEVELETAKQKRSLSEFEIRVVGELKKTIWLEVKANFSKYSKARPFFYCVISDITEKKNKEESLSSQTKKYKNIIDSTNEITFDYAVSKDELKLDATHIDKIGKDITIKDFVRERLLGTKNIHEEDVNRFKENYKRAVIEKSNGSFEFRSTYFSDKQEWYRIYYSCQLNSKNEVKNIVGVVLNIDSDKVVQNEMNLKYQLDEFTGLYAKNYIKPKITEVIRENPNGTHAMMIIDIDNFKGINDTYGHMIADEIVVKIAGSFAKYFRDEDVLGRFGGDEFVIFMSNISKEIVNDRIKKVVNEIRNSNRTIFNIEICVSVGIAYYAKDGFDYETLFSKADKAMYYIKHHGKNSVITYEEMVNLIVNKK